jgi:hypothetical protein
MSQSHIPFTTTIASFAAAVFLFLAVLSDSSAVQAQSRGIDNSTTPSVLAQTERQALPAGIDSRRSAPARPAAHIKEGDEIAFLRAIDNALTRAADGATYVWRRDNGRMQGAIHLTGTFRDVAGRICRHMEIVLTAGIYTRRTEGVACRRSDKSWVLEG